MSKHLQIVVQRAQIASTENFSLGPPADQAEGIAALNVWMRSSACIAGERQEVAFKLSQIDSCKSASLEHRLDEGMLHIGDSIEVTVVVDSGPKAAHATDQDNPNDPLERTDNVRFRND